ncbi:MAG: hypothetical protein MPN21_11295 [Thermoanaerobaculia bacterium]|nr:hypothetical protein [Thermoanaerobaculia bacterium]
MSDERKTQNHGSVSSSADAERNAETHPSFESDQIESAGVGAASTQDRPTVETTVRAISETEVPIQAAVPEEKSHPAPSGVSFFPDRVVTEEEARRLLASDSEEGRIAVISHLLTYAEWDEIWRWVDRETVRELFDKLDLPPRLRVAWARNLRLTTRPG